MSLVGVGFGITNLKVSGVSGSNVTIAGSFSIPSCGRGKAPELRRPAKGIKECIGFIKGRSGNTLRLDTSVCGGKSPKPQVGETVYIYCGGVSGASGGGNGIAKRLPSGIPSPTAIGESGIPMWVFLVGGGVLLYFLLS